MLRDPRLHGSIVTEVSRNTRPETSPRRDEAQPSGYPSSEPGASDDDSQVLTPPEMENDNPSTESDSKSSNCPGTSNGEQERENQGSNEFERLVIRSLPAETAKHFLRSVKGKLRHRPLQQVPSHNIQSMSLLEALDVDWDLMKLPPGVKSTAGSSNSGGTTASCQPEQSFSASGAQGHGSGQGYGGDGNDGARNNGANNDDTEEAGKSKESAVPNLTETTNTQIRKFRCPFNAYSPKLYCERGGGKKYSRCGGVGWKNMQDVK